MQALEVDKSTIGGELHERSLLASANTQPVNILGLEIKPGDFIHADQHGAMTVPKKHLDALPHALDLVVKKEVPILEAARQRDFNIEKLKKAFQASWDIK